MTPLVPLAAVLAISAWAQEAPPPWIVVRVDTVKPGMTADYEGFQKEISAAYKKAGVPWRSVMQAAFGELRQFVTVTPLMKFADMDGASPLEKAVGKDGVARISATGSKLVDSSMRLAARTMPELGIATPMKAPPAFALLTHYEVAPGRNADFEAWMKNEYLPAMKKAEVGNWLVSRGIFGSNLNMYTTVRYVMKLAEIDGGPIIIRALGAEGAGKLVAKQAGVVLNVRQEIWRVRNDLGYAPMPAAPAGSH